MPKDALVFSSQNYNLSYNKEKCYKKSLISPNTTFSTLRKVLIYMFLYVFCFIKLYCVNIYKSRENRIFSLKFKKDEFWKDDTLKELFQTSIYHLCQWRICVKSNSFCFPINTYKVILWYTWGNTKKSLTRYNIKKKKQNKTVEVKS